MQSWIEINMQTWVIDRIVGDALNRAEYLGKDEEEIENTMINIINNPDDETRYWLDCIDSHSDFNADDKSHRTYNIYNPAIRRNFSFLNKDDSIEVACKKIILAHAVYFILIYEKLRLFSTKIIGSYCHLDRVKTVQSEYIDKYGISETMSGGKLALAIYYLPIISRINELDTTKLMAGENRIHPAKLCSYDITKQYKQIDIKSYRAKLRLLGIDMDEKLASAELMEVTGKYVKVCSINYDIRILVARTLAVRRLTLYDIVEYLAENIDMTERDVLKYLDKEYSKVKCQTT